MGVWEPWVIAGGVFAMAFGVIFFAIAVMVAATIIKEALK